jgi:hypothetical protein
MICPFLSAERLRSIFVRCWLVVAFSVPAISAETNQLWAPAQDQIYLQELNRKIPFSEPVQWVAVHRDKVWLVASGQLHQLQGNDIVKIQSPTENIHLLRALDDRLWLGGSQGLYEWSGNSWNQVTSAKIVDLCLHRGLVHMATRDDIFRLDGDQLNNIKPSGGYLSSDTTVVQEDFSQILADPVRIGPIDRIDSYSGTLYLLGRHRLSLLDGDTFFPNPIDWGTLPGNASQDMLVQGSRLFIATNRGLAVLRGMAVQTLDGSNRFPLEETTCLAAGFAGDLWIGTTSGAIRSVDGQFHYFGADHWLPGDGVNHIAVTDHSVYIATDKGLGIIEYRPYTLQKKADYYEKQLERWGHLRMGFAHKLYWSDQHQQWLREISDNDGGHTAHYLAAMCYKFAVTGSPEDREKAVDAFRAMVWLESITPSPGFIARAIWSKQADLGQRSERGSGGLPAKWYDTEDGLWQWKGDTSSDEVNGHMYSVSLFHDLVASGEEKQRAAEHLARISSHIIDNGWVLRDMDGKPTRWGRWDPEYLLRPYGQISQGLNGLEAQSYMWTAWALTGDSKFKEGLDQLIQWRYHTFTVRHKHVFPPDTIVPWDDELAYRSLYPILRYTDDPYLYSIYRRALERSHEMLRCKKLPHFNFVYGAMTGNDFDLETSVQHLREWSLDLVSHRYRNSHRRDLQEEPDYPIYTIGTRAISPREKEAQWGSRTSVAIDGGQASRGVTPAIGWLEDYWMGRYYGFILPPTERASELLEAKDSEIPDGGAEPYSGPDRPERT